MSNFDDKAARAAEQGVRILVQIFKCNSSYCFWSSPFLLRTGKGYFVLGLSLLALELLVKHLLTGNYSFKRRESWLLLAFHLYEGTTESRKENCSGVSPIALHRHTQWKTKDFEKEIFRLLSLVQPSVANSNLFHNIHPSNDVGSY